MNHELGNENVPGDIQPETDADQRPGLSDIQHDEDGFSATFVRDPRQGLYLKVQAETPAEEIQTALARASDLFQKHGRPFAAFMKLPDILATDPNLEEVFLESYAGEFDSWDEIVDRWLVVHDWEAALRGFAAQYGMEEFVRIDRDLLKSRIREVWDIVPDGALLYAFNK
ncbi:hypothetical protein GCM10012320_08410 [Sinomonas cellulolyticus]|uniref:Uncharacterized protein n=1 Tax=Sinomonas cellulolyticus TaxID=2801916 RepID=A0ABS1K7L4_9MICC|nr:MULTISPECIES: hypothetical protein [Sinomonas]MBL0706301.1 hypothetical protein [Sinomonas cellulolyticus]GHG43950.1 hypothetical protein GCM10012320_08410 [Sinomonas sp. KCTC 49339]